MNDHVLESQAWLNANYGSRPGWETLDEDGVIGWQTVQGVQRALQAELGISPLVPGFGDAARAAFRARIGRIDGGTTDTRLLMILSCALWCKGSPGLPSAFYHPGAGDPDPAFGMMSGSVADLRVALGLGAADPHVDVKMMAWLLSMETYRLISGGTAPVQAVQRWLNGTYADEPALDLVATHGLFSRSTHRALMIATQIEIGVPAREANGVFGPQTRGRLRGDYRDEDGEPVPVHRGPYFDHLFQAWLTVNGYPLVVDGDIDARTRRAAAEFREFMALTDVGDMSAGTWMALMVSCGDPDRDVTGFDHALQLAAADYEDARDKGYRVVGRYLSGVTQRDGVPYDKFLGIDEISALKAKSFGLLPIYQVMENDVSYMSYDNGYRLGVLATQRAHVVGLPENSVVYFAVDFDAHGATVTGPVMDHFRGIDDAVSSVSGTYPLRVGVYGGRNVCDLVVKEGLAAASFIAGAAYAWVANMGHPMPRSWHYNQIQATDLTLAGTSREIDKVVVSPAAEPVDACLIAGPPPELDGRASATGYGLDLDWFIGATHDVERGFAARGDAFDRYRDAADDYLVQAIQRLAHPGAPWRAYAPFGAPEALEAAGEVLAARELGVFDEIRDARRFAVALRGHERHGVVPRGWSAWTPGDLGGWGFDLYSLWVRLAAGKAAARIPAGDVYEFVSDNLGGDESLFSTRDLVADADAVLVASRREMLVASRREAEGRYSAVLRDVLSTDAQGRIRQFYRTRFAGRRSTAVDAVSQLAAGVDHGSVREAFGMTYNEVCGSPDPFLPKPTVVQAEAMGRAFADLIDGI
ncbi:glycoside hydrolase domain-containing protein [Myceligenerans pegani]|uniref:DUF1906 domain-containing protein n=1 Tax=Myceligenerans pegani TaxID=2776917 RepID=A0ABR9N217_9MICO|nr:glycoside hydrolase domain-containing protein [Myceligenerans sp. TRM 65318]MBE1877694.1 DUF1906 domain-containing protein [Myceligenerans sp. TRM 65318]MBE3019965.1 DUF1906 domain-containing protein [Myceligenerans sp. TRM 65318]